MSGNTGTFKASPISNSSGFDRTVAIVKELQVGDTIEGLDAEKNPALCTVEAIGQFGHGPLFGNYTDDHFVLDPATGGIKQHGAVGNRTVEDKYEVMTSCPVGLDEAGTGFTPMDGDFCGQATAEMAWSDYLLIHASMLRIIRATGGYWLSASAYSDFDSVVEHGPELCAAMLACAGPETDCDELERVSELFIDHYLTEDARNASHVGMPGLGKVGAPGSASFVVSQGNADNDKSISTEGIVLIASAAVLAATVAAVLVVAAVRRQKRSTPARIIIETEPITDSSAIKDDSAV